MPLTAPHEAAVVTVANSAVAATPKRASLPSRLPPSASSAASAWRRAGVGCCSKYAALAANPANSTVMAARMATPCRRLPTISPKVQHSAAGIRRIASISSRLDQALGFSYGWAELALKKPPPLVPSSLMASCEATGPMGRVCTRVTTVSVRGWPAGPVMGWPCASSRAVSYCCACTVCASTYGSRFCTTPWLTSASARMNDSGSSTYSVARTRSAQKLPSVAALWRASPRTRAISTAMPVAAETKFCTVSASICVR
ncbi:Uncharacterised protein [Bordetella pertussis]|nr:Uncharacterised protein [Bordetella pertussis]CFP02421.1 Uncharacterised protein [Bordetella pertussis]CFP65032.1 Uncharacterised protein [Bordetella pertussis]CPJ28402.1 Uncharacterised protein [Bordetella pertussis]CPO76073.1 Uncharacterised protein [Bordetella pertussis]